MTRKSMRAAAAAGTSVFDQIASGNVQTAQDVQNTQTAKDAQSVQNVENAKNVKGTKNVQDTKDVQSAQSVQSAADAPRMERLNLKIPTELKEYLTIAAAKASIERRRTVSLTQYLCDLVAADMAQHGDE